MNPASILLVDDDPEIRDLLGAFLAREGFDAVTAADGAEIDAVLAHQTPDLIVLDLMLPGEDGVSICRRPIATRGASGSKDS